MLLSINKVAHGIGMQNQYLYARVYDGIVKGELSSGNDYHSDEAKVEINSLLEWVHTRYPDYWGEKQYKESVNFLNNLLKGKNGKESI
ncbi:MAG: hypothetical protein PHF86_14645 [Candidatus Nanoarchaeia archaeon]|jgi:hypothetical protein|nr:hypothetical protein [Candidatus Nanoarchaeia archaeon]